MFSGPWSANAYYVKRTENRFNGLSVTALASTIPMLPNLNLPWPILVHAVGLTVLGVKLLFVPSSALHGRASETQSMLGITTAGLGLAYLSTAYVPMHENQLLYASAPVRMILAGLAGVKLCVSGKNMSASQWQSFWGVVLYDGIGGFLLGWWLGTWGGRLPRV